MNSETSGRWWGVAGLFHGYLLVCSFASCQVTVLGVQQLSNPCPVQAKWIAHIHGPGSELENTSPVP